MKTGSELLKQSCRQPFGENVSILRTGWHMKDPDSTNGNLLSYKVDIQLYVFCPSMLNRVCREVDCSDIIAINNGGLLHRTAQLLEKMTNPASLSNDGGDSTILSFSTRPR